MSEEMTVQMLREENSLTPASWLFCEKTRWKFVVPVYQRLFAWKEAQFDRLLCDLDMYWSENNQDEAHIAPYYLGIITVVKQKLRGEYIYILVDGQQRLTVIALLAAVLEKDEKKRQMFSNICSFLCYQARPDDKVALESIVCHGADWLKQYSEDEANHENFINVLKEAHIASDSMRTFVWHIVKHQKKWETLWSRIERGLLLFVAELPEIYETNLQLQNEYFEKMNSSGKQLEPHEILKVRICQSGGEIDEWNEIEDFTKKYQSPGATSTSEPICLMKAIQSAPPKGKGSRKTSIEKWRPSLIDFPMFLLHVLELTLKDQNDDAKIRKDSHKLLEQFESETLSKVKCAFVKKMQAYRQFLDRWIIHKEVLSETVKMGNEDGFDGDDSRFKYWKTPKNDGEAGELVYVENSCEDDLKRKLKQLQMTLFALGGERQAWIADAFLYCKPTGPSSELSVSISELYTHLRDYLIKETSFWDEQGDSREINGTLQGGRREEPSWPDSYLTYTKAQPADFLCLDYFLWELANFNESLFKKFFAGAVPSVIKSFVPRANRSVEHFHPQTDTHSFHRGEYEDNNSAKPGWGALIPVVAGSKNGKTLKDIFGNLALISAGRNSEYSNYTVYEKSARIKQQIEAQSLESIKLWLMSRECDGKDEQWTPERARQHANKMLQVIRWGIGVGQHVSGM